MADSERRKKGKEIFKKAYGDVLPLPKEPLTPYGEMVMDQIFAELWSREVLSMRDKRILVLGMLAGQCADQMPFEIHVRSALQNGEMTLEELDEMVPFFLHYCGAATASWLFAVVEKVKADSRK